MRLAVLTGMFALFLAGAAAAQDFRPDQIVSTVVEIADKQVPLPPGEWRVAAYGHNTIDKADTDKRNFGAFGAIQNLFLVKAGRGVVDAVVEINVNALPVTDGWGIPQDCLRKDIYLALSRYKSGWDSSCLFLRHTISTRDDMPPVEPVPEGPVSALWTTMKQTLHLSGAEVKETAREAGAASTAFADTLAYVQAQGLAVPRIWATVGFRVSNRQDIVDVRYHFNPVGYGMPPSGKARWEDSVWHVARIEQDPVKTEFVWGLMRWAATFQPYVAKGLKNQIRRDVPPPAPFNGTMLSLEEAASQERLATLDRLYQRAVLTDQQYQEQRTLVLNEGLREIVPPTDSNRVALYKTLTYRIIVSTLNVGIDYYWIGQPFAAGVLIFLQVTVNSTKFYFHELAWEKYGGYKAARRDSPRTLDFVYAGFGGHAAE